MKSFVRTNRQAWDEAYRNAPDGYKDIVSKLRVTPDRYVRPFLKQHLDVRDIRGKDIAQFACNNGREILSLGLTHGARSMTGFDLAPQMVADANLSAQALQAPATFVEADLNALDTAYHDRYDTLFVMIGVLCWFDDLEAFFTSCAQALKPGGVLYLLDGHPFTNVFAFEGEEGFQPEHPFLPVHSYFRTAPFVDYGMEYMTEVAPETAFTSYIHSLESLFQGLLKHFELTLFKESNQDELDLFPALHEKEYPLIFLLQAQAR